jgi:ubiquinone biosynthesis monooxygenase Coq7
MNDIDRAIAVIDSALRTIAGVHRSGRARPGGELPEADLAAGERAHAAALMRVNHVGEVCAQALYQGQALTARDPANREALAKAALEEQDHLQWSAGRIAELGGRASLLNPLWYAGALAMGAAAGALGDRWNLAFLAETERQVEEHLEGHLSQLSPADRKTRVVIQSMRDDEARHRATAVALGAADLPQPIKEGMRLMAKIMTTVAYRL